MHDISNSTILALCKLIDKIKRTLGVSPLINRELYKLLKIKKRWGHGVGSTQADASSKPVL